MKQNLTTKQVIIRFFSATGMTGQNQHNCPDFFCQEKFFEVLGKGVAKGLGPHPIKMLFQIFRLNFSWNMYKMYYFSNKFLNIAKRCGLSAPSASWSSVLVT